MLFIKKPVKPLLEEQKELQKF